MINNFTYYTPTKVVFGKSAERDIGQLVRAQSCQKVLLHYGGQSAIKSGLLDKIKASLKQYDIDYIALGGVVPNPHLSLVKEGIALCKKENIDFILAIGGGSVIDSAKAIACGALVDWDVWDLFTGDKTTENALPVGTVLTIAAAGSEMSASTVITKEEGGLKRSYSHNVLRPVFAIMNPELTMTLPDYQTASGCVDIIMHTMERYFNKSDNLDLTDSISEGLIKTVMKHAKILVKDPQNYHSRAEVMWASSLSHNGLTGCGTDGGDWASHRIEHEIGGMFDVAHGAGLSAIWGSWARYVYRERLERFSKFAVNVMGITASQDLAEVALSGIATMESFFASIKMPITINELGISPTKAQLEEMAEKCIAGSNGSIGVVKELKAEDILAIYELANK